MIKKIFLSVAFCTVSVFTMAQSQTVTHVVQRGETIESIAEIYKVSVEDINKTNPNADGIVYVGMKLVIPTNTKEPSLNYSESKESVSRRTTSKDQEKQNRIAQKKTKKKHTKAIKQFRTIRFTMGTVAVSHFYINLMLSYMVYRWNLAQTYFV